MWYIFLSTSVTQRSSTNCSLGLPFREVESLWHPCFLAKTKIHLTCVSIEQITQHRHCQWCSFLFGCVCCQPPTQQWKTDLTEGWKCYMVAKGNYYFLAAIFRPSINFYFTPNKVCDCLLLPQSKKRRGLTTAQKSWKCWQVKRHYNRAMFITVIAQILKGMSDSNNSTGPVFSKNFPFGC